MLCIDLCEDFQHLWLQTREMAICLSADNLKHVDNIDVNHANKVDNIDVNHANMVDNIDVNHANMVDNIDVNHANMVDNIDVNHANMVDNIDVNHANMVDNIDVNHANMVDNIDVNHANKVDNIDVNHANMVDNIDVNHANMVDNIDVNHANMVDNIDVNHPHMVDNIDVNHANMVDNIDVNHAHMVDNIDVNHANMVDNIDVNHAHMVDNIDVNHANTVDNRRNICLLPKRKGRGEKYHFIMIGACVIYPQELADIHASQSWVITPSKIIKLLSHQSSHLAPQSWVITPSKIIKLLSHGSSHLASKSWVITPCKIIKLLSHGSSHLAPQSWVITPSDSNWMQYPDGDQLLSFEKLDRASPDLWPEKNRASQVQLSEDTPEGPDVNLGAKREPKHHLRGPIKWCLEAEIFVVEGYFTVHSMRVVKRVSPRKPLQNGAFLCPKWIEVGMQVRDQVSLDEVIESSQSPTSIRQQMEDGGIFYNLI
ncbi:hypothetical protein MAR_002373 [Mya arenaria]|uniref:Uncharacterized protein n=1 Tax=Mya arenaria TaxID=6604 RepID=A0ABY7FEN1_MYAAR|nr:hypothetical protein MAR_002373 [Mya arenaria]